MTKLAVMSYVNNAGKYLNGNPQIKPAHTKSYTIPSKSNLATSIKDMFTANIQVGATIFTGQANLN